MYFYLLAFGSNLGDKLKNLNCGLIELQSYCVLLRQSSWLTTLPLRSNIYDTSCHAEYINFICEVKTQLNPEEFYAKIFAIENKVGHDRQAKWLPRELDIDILFAGFDSNSLELEFSKVNPIAVYNQVSGLKIPHPDFFNRDFLVQLAINDMQIKRELLESHYELKG